MLQMSRSVEVPARADAATITLGGAEGMDGQVRLSSGLSAYSVTAHSSNLVSLASLHRTDHELQQHLK